MLPGRQTTRGCQILASFGRYPEKFLRQRLVADQRFVLLPVSDVHVYDRYEMLKIVLLCTFRILELLTRATCKAIIMNLFLIRNYFKEKAAVASVRAQFFHFKSAVLAPDLLFDILISSSHKSV